MSTTTVTTESTDVRRTGFRAVRLLEAPARREPDPADPGFQAYMILRAAFVVAPVLFGVDKFFNWMTPWTRYLWPGIVHHLPWSAQHIMDIVGAVEILAGILVLLVPRVAPYVVAGWLAGIVTDLVIQSISIGGHTRVFWDIALRDFGLMLAALALARLAAVYAPAPLRRRRSAGSRSAEEGIAA